MRQSPQFHIRCFALARQKYNSTKDDSRMKKLPCPSIGDIAANRNLWNHTSATYVRPI